MWVRHSRVVRTFKSVGRVVPRENEGRLWRKRSEQKGERKRKKGGECACCVSVRDGERKRTRHGGRQGERGIHLAEERTDLPEDCRKRESDPARATSISSSRSSTSGCSGEVVVGCTLLR